MNYITYFLELVFILFIWKYVFFSYKPKNDIYDEIFAHRGIHYEDFFENTLNAYRLAIRCNLGIELDIRCLKDGTLVCFHDRYMSRLIGIPGNIERKTYNKVKELKLKNGQRIPTLKKALKSIEKESKITGNNGAILIEVKGNLSKSYLASLMDITKRYNGRIYFHAKNVLTYIILRKTFGKRKVFLVINVFRKRFNFIKGKKYQKLHLGTFFDHVFSLDDSQIADAFREGLMKIESVSGVEEIIRKFYKISIKETSRITPEHFLLSGRNAHRATALLSKGEHSKKNISLCIRNGLGLEIDFQLDKKGILRVYHSDKASDMLGQRKTGASKIALGNSLTGTEFFRLANGGDIIIDIKSFRIFKHKVELAIDKAIEESNFKGNFTVQSWNPFVVKWYYKNRPNYIRGQVINSTEKLHGKVPLRFIWGVLYFMVFHGHPDYICADINWKLKPFLNLAKICGLPRIGYAPKNSKESEEFSGLYNNFICDDLLNKRAWPNKSKTKTDTI